MQHASSMSLSLREDAEVRHSGLQGSKPSTGPATADDAGDVLRPARGIVNGLAISVALWGLIGWGGSLFF